jgi:hypothetical protein
LIRRQRSTAAYAGGLVELVVVDNPIDEPVCSAPMSDRSLPSALAALLVLGAGFGLIGSAAARGLDGRPTSVLQLFDANIRYTSGIFIPVGSYTPASMRPLTTDTWSRAARSPSRVVADGVTVLLIRAELPSGVDAATFTVRAEQLPATDPGSLWMVDDQNVVDASSEGRTIDTNPPGPSTLTVPTVVIGGRTFAFLLYRAPRNFDGDATDTLAGRTVSVLLLPPRTGSAVTVASLTIVRPLVVFVHGTSGDNDAWIAFPLWRNSANELDDRQRPSSSTLPFSTDRISFNWIWNANGGVVENAATILPQLVRAVRDWREATGTAATQADVITHSFGGFVARQVVQTQPDPNPLTPAASENFRAAANWGHGSIHKLITLGGTHRGSAFANATAFLNQNGIVPGLARFASCAAGQYIDQGALRDQLVLSPALRALGQTRVPGHAVVGSGRALLEPRRYYVGRADVSGGIDQPTGPYAAAYHDPNCRYDAFYDYVFNLDKNVPPVTIPSCSVVPNYDLTVSAESSAGLMPAGATTTPTDLERSSGLSLIGKLNHAAFVDPSYGSGPIVDAVSDRLVFLLQQPTTSRFFGAFPAVASVVPTALEQAFSLFDPSWLRAGLCPPPLYQPGCTAAYSRIKVIPERLALESPTPAPLFVYGLLDGQWVLAYAPTPLVDSAPPVNRNCAVTLTSSDPTVVGFVTNPVTGAKVPVATGIGTATITIAVEGFTGNIPTVPVTVTGFGN